MHKQARKQGKNLSPFVTNQMLLFELMAFFPSSSFFLIFFSCILYSKIHATEKMAGACTYRLVSRTQNMNGTVEDLKHTKKDFTSWVIAVTTSLE